MKLKTQDLDGLVVKILGRTFDVVDMEHRQETTSNAGHGGSYTVSDVTVFAVEEPLPKQDIHDDIYSAKFSRGETELEEVKGTLSIDHFADGTRFTISTPPKPVFLPTVEQDTLGKTS